MLRRRDFLAAGGLAAAGVAVELKGGEAGKPPASPGRPLRVGSIGVGQRGSSLVEAALQVPGIEIVAICDIDPEHRDRARNRVEQAGRARPAPFDDWKALLSRDDIEAVISALPCDLHYACYRDVLEAEKHLYGEKPLCLRVDHADDLVRRSKRSGRVFQVGFQRRFSHIYRAAIAAFQEGIIGRPFEGRGVRFGSGGPYRKPGEWFSFRERSGDWMLEQAVHHWDGLTWALGELPVRAVGSGRQDLFKDWDSARDVSDYYTAIIEYASGLIFNWTHTWAAPPARPFNARHEHLVGPKGGIDLSTGFIAFRKGGSSDERKTRQLSAEKDDNMTVVALGAFRDAIRQGRDPVVGVEDGRKATLYGLLVREAVYRRRPVTMREILEGEGQPK